MKALRTGVCIVLLTGHFSLDAAAADAPTPSVSRFATSHTELPATLLVKGATLDRKLHGAEVHRYTAHLEAGDFASIHVRQIGGNAVVAVFDPEGKLIDLVDRNPSGYIETVELFARKDGDYSIQTAIYEWDTPSVRYSIRFHRLGTSALTPEGKAAQLFESWYDPALPGAAMAVLKGDEVVLQRTMGLADAAQGTQITPQTRFDLASTSKQFTALAIALLARRGALKLDDDVRQHIPELPSFKAPIRIRHLLHHTSGLRDWDVCFGLMGRDIEDGITKAEIIDFVSRQQELNFVPGSSQIYSNTGYNVLAEVVARVARQPFPEFVRQNILAPAGMKALVNEDALASIPGIAASYAQLVPSPVLRSASATAAAGSSSLQASLDDMIAWARSFRRSYPGLEAAGDTLSRPGTLDDGTSHGYGLGLWFGEHRGIARVGHLGLAAGYRISFRRYPSRDLTFIYMTNDGNDGSYLRAEMIENLFLGLEPDAVQVPEGEYQPPTASGLPMAALNGYSGLYYSEELRTVYRIGVFGSALTASHAINGTIRLNPADGDSFVTDRWYMPRLTFVRGTAKSISGFEVTSEGARNILFRKVTEPTP